MNKYFCVFIGPDRNCLVELLLLGSLVTLVPVHTAKIATSLYTNLSAFSSLGGVPIMTSSIQLSFSEGSSEGGPKISGDSCSLRQPATSSSVSSRGVLMRRVTIVLVFIVFHYRSVHVHLTLFPPR